MELREAVESIDGKAGSAYQQASREAKQAIKSALGERMGSMSTGEHCRRAGKSRTAGKKKKTAKNSRVRAKFGGRLGEGSVCKTGDFEVRLVPKGSPRTDGWLLWTAGHHQSHQTPQKRAKRTRTRVETQQHEQQQPPQLPLHTF